MLSSYKLNFLSLRILFSSFNLFSPLNSKHFYINNFFFNYLLKFEGIFNFFSNILTTLFTRFFNNSVWFENQKINYSTFSTAMEKYYLRQLLFGNTQVANNLSLFFKNNNKDVINIGHNLELNVPMVFETTSFNLEEEKSSYPLFSCMTHFNTDNKNIFSGYAHPFHIVDPSPWPFTTSMGLWYLAFTTVAFFYNYVHSILNIVFGIVYLCTSLAFWWRDVIRESTYEFKHTPYVRRGLLNGVLLFIISEVMFFFGFFWAFFHSSLAPSQYIGGIWPPLVIDSISPWQLPLVNTLCLLLSGVTLTIAHRQLNGLPYYNQTVSLQWPLVRRLILWMQITVFLGIFFLCCQAVEYYLSPFTFQDTVFGGTFYILTGLHGLHVLVGATFLLVCLWRASRLHFTLWKQVGFKAAVWYWHFVDVVWIFLYIVIYIWSGATAYFFIFIFFR